MTTMTLDRNFSVSLDDMRDVEGGTPFHVLAGGVIATGAALIGVAAFGYSIGKDLAERQNDECECPEESKGN